MTADALNPAIDAPLVAEPTFFGQPRGLFYLAFTEAWERFSFYGMSSLLVLYMTQQLFLPGHVEQIAGFAAFRSALEGMTGAHSPQALASQIYGLYSGFVYFTPVLGGFVADRWLGARNTVVIGALLMSAGHVAMAFDESFLLALVMLVVGCGCLKGNISAQVGALYPVADAAGRTRGFAIFSMAINFGAIAGPLVCGLLGTLYGWHFGFGAAALLMLLGLATYLYGYRQLPANARRRRDTGPADPLTTRDWKVIALLLLAMALTIFHSIAYYQVGNAGAIWIDANVDLTFGGFRVPTPWFSSIDPFFSVIGVPLLFWLWRKQAEGRGEPSDLMKIAQGSVLAMCANLVLVVATIVQPDGGKVSILWPFIYCALLGIAFLYYWPTLLALVSRAAPAKVNATMMGIAFLSLFIGNNMVGVLGGLYETMTPTAFWAMHAAVGGIGAALLFILARPISRALG